jgi:hypothetical protein
VRKLSVGHFRAVAFDIEEVGANAVVNSGYPRAEVASQFGSAVFGEAGLNTDADEAAE